MLPDTAPLLNGRPDTVPFPRIIAHRGARKVAPENTLAAFRIAAQQGALGAEFDVSLLGDGTPVLHHDATLDRCSDRTGPLAEIGQADIAGIDCGSWFSSNFAGEPLATLDQGLDLLHDLEFVSNLEMKPHGAAKVMARAVAAALGHRPEARAEILISSFDLNALAAFRALMPEQPIAVLYDNPPEDWPEALADLAASSLHVWRENMSEDLVRAAARAGVHLRVYTVNDPAEMVTYRDHPAGELGGIITDHPPAFLDDPDWVRWAQG
ncbi:MAG: glycerophosphodiester phosphodiesterase family protein [Paracoccaceae bacterium]|nr:glycerophosphodiester phosphodiesterase family protein [Paracoccaceae bacterium]